MFVTQLLALQVTLTGALSLGRCEIHEAATLTTSTSLTDSSGSILAVSISGDVAVVGTSATNDCASGYLCGSAYVHRFDGNSWVLDQRLASSDAAAGDLFGYSVSASGDTIVVGALGDDCAEHVP